MGELLTKVQTAFKSAFDVEPGTITLGASRVVLRSSVCLLAVLVSVQVMAQSHRASIPGHKARASNATVGSSNVTPSSGLNFAPAVPYPSGGDGANSVAIAQLRGTGKPFDLVVTNWCADSSCTTPGTDVGVLLGNGDGTFAAAATYSSGGIYADAVAVAQLRGTGHPLDIVVVDCGANTQTNCSGGSVGVLLGNGDGTFGTATVISLAPYGATSVAVADVNGDGFPDLIVGTGSNTAGLVGVLLNDGTGKFPTEATYGSGGISPLAIAVANLGNGQFDVVVANQWTDNSDTSSNVSVLTGNGNGTFNTAMRYATGGFFPDSIAITDVNGDGKVDLVVANSSVGSVGGLGNVGVLLGNGDGTFGTAIVTPTLAGAYGAASAAVADVNGDGKPDLVVAYCSSTSSDCSGGGGTVGLLLGNGDGTFQTPVTFGPGGNTPFWVAVDDLNGDGKPDIVAANCVSGNCAAGPGNLGVLLNTSLTPTATALTSSPNPSKFGQTVTLTATVTDLPGFDKGTPTGTVSFFDGTTKIGTSNLNSSGVATLPVTTLAVGTDSITATYNGDTTNFATSTSPAVQQVVQSAQGATSTALTLSAGTVAVGSSVTLTAKVSAGTTTPPDGETVTFEDVTKTPPTALGAGKLSKGTATFTSTAIPAGTYSMVASYPGDANFQPSTSTPAQALDVQSFTLSASPTTVTVSAPGQSGSTTITIATLGKLKASSVTGFACSGLPSESTCTFGAVSSNNTVSLSITTTGPSARIFRHHQGLFYAMLLPGFLGMFSMAGRKRTLRGLRLLALIVVLGLSAMWVACGGGSTSGGGAPNTGTPTGTSSVTVSAASGTLQGSTKITLTVQ